MTTRRLTALALLAAPAILIAACEPSGELLGPAAEPAEPVDARMWRSSGYTETGEPIYEDEPADAGVPEQEASGRLRVPVGYTDTGEPIYEDEAV